MGTRAENGSKAPSTDFRVKKLGGTQVPTEVRCATLEHFLLLWVYGRSSDSGVGLEGDSRGLRTGHRVKRVIEFLH